MENSLPSCGVGGMLANSRDGAIAVLQAAISKLEEANAFLTADNMRLHLEKAAFQEGAATVAEAHSVDIRRLQAQLKEAHETQHDLEMQLLELGRSNLQGGSYGGVAPVGPLGLDEGEECALHARVNHCAK